jgi:hypothetical protein
MYALIESKTARLQTAKLLAPTAGLTDCIAMTAVIGLNIALNRTCGQPLNHKRCGTKESIMTIASDCNC